MMLALYIDLQICVFPRKTAFPASIKYASIIGPLVTICSANIPAGIDGWLRPSVEALRFRLLHTVFKPTKASAICYEWVGALHVTGFCDTGSRGH